MTSMLLQNDVDAGRKVQMHQRIDRLSGRVHDVDQTFVRTTFELFARVLVLERAAKNREDLFFRRERNRTRDDRAGFFGGVNDLLRRLIQQSVIVGFQSDSDDLVCCHW